MIVSQTTGGGTSAPPATPAPSRSTPSTATPSAPPTIHAPVPTRGTDKNPGFHKTPDLKPYTGPNETLDLSSIADGDLIASSGDGRRPDTVDADVVFRGKGKKAAQKPDEDSPAQPADSAAQDPEPAPEPKPKKDPTLEPEGFDDNETPAPAETPAAPQPPAKRDYSVFKDPVMAKIARSLRNDDFAEFLKHAPQWQAALEENKTLREAAARTPSFHFEHPDGYLLDPAWPQLQQAYAAHGHERSHWEQQLLAIKQGLPWKDFLGYDKNGNPQYRDVPALENGQVDFRAELRAQQQLLRAQQGESQAELAASQLVQGYGTKVKQAKESMTQLQRKLFPSLDLNNLAGENAEHAKNVDAFLKTQIPAEFTKHPMADMAKLMYITMMNVSNKARKWKEELDRANAQLAGRARAGNSRLPAEGTEAAPAADLINLDDLRNVD
jgi:hypothetical protein